MRYALVKNGVIENCIEWDGSPNWSPETSTLAVPAPDGFGPGDSYDAATLQFSKGPVASPAPDIPGFIAAVKQAMGGAVGSNALARAYPLFYPAVQQAEWDDVKALMRNAAATGVLAPEQAAAMLSIAVEYHIPLA